ncbi:MAG: BspA family leucine-rich repeat surface protein, partial [Defluviitaleaceae bacterium]|nr:BspA family leucine-rich repeat surface protein [Defluviitaleaceae bacterium]
MEMRKTQARLGLVKVFTAFSFALLMALCVAVLTDTAYASAPCSCDVPHSVMANGKFDDSEDSITGAEWWLYECGELVVGGGYINNTAWWGSPWGDYAYDITHISFTAPITAGESLRYLFDSLYNVTEIEGLGFFNTSRVTDMGDMFYGASGLTALDLSSFDTSNVMHMDSMFNGASGLTTLDLSSFDTSNVTSMYGMFGGASGLTALDLSDFDTSKVTDMFGMFFDASGLTTLDLSKWNTSNVTDMSVMFSGASGLTTLDVSGFDTSNVTDMMAMFFGASGLTSLDLSDFDTRNVTDMSGMFFGASGLTTLDLSKWNTSKVTAMNGMFFDASGLTTLDLSGLDTSKVTDMMAMFLGASGLTSLDLSDFDTRNVTDMMGMFYDASGLTSLDLSGFDTGNVMYMDMMFLGTSDLKSITFGEKFITRGYNSLPEVSEENGNGWRTVGNSATLQSDELWEYLRTNDSRNTAEQWAWAAALCPECEQFPCICPTPEPCLVCELDPCECCPECEQYPCICPDEPCDICQQFPCECCPECEKYPCECVNTCPYCGAELSANDKFPDHATLGTGAEWWLYECGELVVGGGYINNYDWSSPWGDYADNITRISFTAPITAGETLQYLFSNLYNVTEIEGLGFFDTSKVMNMFGMFYGASGLTSLDLSSFDTSKVMYMDSMFSGASGLTTLDLSSFDTSNVTSMYGMFGGASGLTALDLSDFDTR